MHRRWSQDPDDYERQELDRLDAKREGDFERVDLELWSARALQLEALQELELRRAALRRRQAELEAARRRGRRWS